MFDAVSVVVSISLLDRSGGKVRGIAQSAKLPGILQKTEDRAMWSENDRARMEKQWHFRLREVLAEPDMTLYFDAAFTLHLICNTPAQVDRLMVNPEDLKHQAWLVCGCEAIDLWFAQERIWSTDGDTTDSGIDMLFTPDELELIQFETDLSEECGMATATIDRMAVEAVQETLPQAISGIVAEEVKAALGGDIKSQVQNFLTSSEFLEMVRGEVRSQLQPFTSNGNGTATVLDPKPAATPEPAAKRSPSTRRQSAAKGKATAKSKADTKKTDA